MEVWLLTRYKGKLNQPAKVRVDPRNEGREMVERNEQTLSRFFSAYINIRVGGFSLVRGLAPVPHLLHRAS